MVFKGQNPYQMFKSIIIFLKDGLTITWRILVAGWLFTHENNILGGDQFWCRSL